MVTEETGRVALGLCGCVLKHWRRREWTRSSRGLDRILPLPCIAGDMEALRDGNCCIVAETSNDRPH